MSKPLIIDWDLVEKLVKVPCSLPDVAIALGIAVSTLRNAVNRERPDLVLRFAQAHAEIKAEANTIDRIRERGWRIAEVVEAHKAAK